MMTTEEKSIDRERAMMVVGDANHNTEQDDDHPGEEEEIPEDMLCGIFGWYPAWLQRLATPKFFMANFSVVAILQGALFTYMVSIMSTLEKRYAFETKVSGFILISDNISEMILSPIVGYLGTRYNRSKIIANGEMMVVLSCLLAALPYFIYGPGLHLIEKQVNSISNQTQFDLCSAKGEESCPVVAQESEWAAIVAKYLSVPVIILWFSNFANGCGYTAFYTVGLPYVDDNIKKKNSPMYLSSLSTIRILGPTTGYLLSSFCLKLYENPFIDPGITNQDPRWIGAWWLGFLILGGGVFFVSLPMFLFPKHLRGLKQSPVTPATNKSTETQTLKFDGVRASLKRLSTNGVLICHTVAGVLRVIGYLGYYINKPKYMELQYDQSASSASFFTGATSVVTMAIGTMAGGFIITRFKPRAQLLAFFITIMELSGILNLFIVSWLKCPTPVFKGMEAILSPTSTSMSTCSAGCQCSTRVYQPICAADGVTNYFSPCYAGCQRYDPIQGSSKLSFHNCSCIETTMSPVATPPTSSPWEAQSGLCDTGCNMFVWFVVMHSAASMIGSLTRTGDMLLILRCVDPRDKSFSLGLTGTLFAIFAFIPYPLIFGAIIDATCLVWEKSCGKTGNCWLYDIEKFRIYLHYGAMSFIAVGMLFQFGTVYFARKIGNLYDDEEEEDVDVEMKSIDSTDAKMLTHPRTSSSSN